MSFFPRHLSRNRFPVVFTKNKRNIACLKIERNELIENPSNKNNYTQDVYSTWNTSNNGLYAAISSRPFFELVTESGDNLVDEFGNLIIIV